MWGIRRGARYTCATVRMASTNKVCALPRILRIPREIFYQTVISFLSTDLAITRILLTPFRTAVVLCTLFSKKSVLFFLTQNTRKTRKPCGMEMLLHGGIRRGARYTCATFRMGSTNKVCALPRILRIPRETFLLGSNFFFLTTDLALTHRSEPMRLAWRV